MKIVPRGGGGGTVISANTIIFENKVHTVLAKSISTFGFWTKNVEIEKSIHCCLKNVFLMLELIPVVFPVAYLPKNSHIKFCGKRSCLKKVMVKKPKVDILLASTVYYLSTGFITQQDENRCDSSGSQSNCANKCLPSVFCCNWTYVLF
jgi:hypothetical protein